MENEVLGTVKDGHNCLVIGQAGTGKTSLLRSAMVILRQMGKRTAITASTGMAASLLGGTTIHRFCGIQDGRFPDDVIITKIINDPEYIHVKTRILATDCLFLDEISMLSKKVFRQVEVVCRRVRGINQAFGGIQVVVAGDFYQLKPVPNVLYGDPGDMVISDGFLLDMIPHRFILRDVHRQSEEKLIRAVQELSQSLPCSPDTEELLKSLERPLPDGDTPVKLFALNYDVEKSNSDSLLEMEGEPTVYYSKDDGDPRALLHCPAKKQLHLKVGAPVILIVNLSDELANGSRGVVKEVLSDNVMVLFQGHGTYSHITNYTFPVYRPDIGRNVAVRKQLPINLAFALTVHKCQGLTLERLVVDCSNMTRPGQIGVAVGRAKTTSGLMVKNFKMYLLQPHPQAVQDFYMSDFLPPSPSLSCCKKEVGNEPSLSDTAKPDIMHSVVEVDNGQTLGNGSDSDNEAEGYMIQVVNVIERNETEIFAISLPQSLEIDTVLASIRYSKPVTPQQISLNEQVEILQTGKDVSILFIKKMYHKLKQLFEHNVTESQFTNRSFTTFYGAVAIFLASDEYKCDVDGLFMCSELKPAHFRVVFGIVQAVRGAIIAESSEPLKKSALESTQSTTRTFEGSERGRAKLRCIAGWCVATLRHQKRQQVRRNLYSSSAKDYVNQTHLGVKVLDELVQSEASLLETSSDTASLLEIQRKNVAGGLCMLSDAAFNWFNNLDTSIRSLETEENVNFHGKNFYSYIRTSVFSDEVLNKQWKDMYVSEGADVIEQCEKVRQELVDKYIRMSSAQFRREFKRKVVVKKKEAHRKQIRMRPDPHPAEPSTSSGSPATAPEIEESEQRKVTKRHQTAKGKGKKSKKIEWPCGECGQDCIVDCVGCDLCDGWYHYGCVGLTGVEPELEEDEWYCPKCKTASKVQ